MTQKNPLRVGVIGARRTRMGTGAFIAGAFHNAGARVDAVCTRSTDTASEAVQSLRKEFGIEARGFDSAERMLGEVPVDIVAICSPTPHHLSHLEVAARYPVHVLCEKPLVWDENPDLLSRTDEILKAFKGRLIRLNTQWPYTLPAFQELHGPDALQEVRSFQMRLSPTVEGAGMILQSASHLISMLQALAGRGEIEGPAWSGYERVNFTYVPREDPPVAVEFLLERVLERPRPAWYAVNELRVDRHIRLPDYTFEFSSGGRRVQAKDPLDLMVRDFLSRADQNNMESQTGEIRDGMALLQTLYETGCRANE